MNLSTDKKKYIESVLDDKCLGWLMPVLETGQSTCKAFMNLNVEFFNCKDYLNSVPGHLLSYSINKQLAIQSLLPSCPFKIYKEEINNRNKYSIPILKKSDVTISMMRSTKRKEIDRNGKMYLKKKCRRNNEIDDQLSIFDSYDPYIHGKDNYHGVLLYGSKKDWQGIEFADIIFFDSHLKDICYSLDLIDKLHIYESTMSNEDKEKSLVNAENLIKDIKKHLEV